jgi:hypothetical protein
MQEPADIGGELLRLGAGQEHAEVQGVEKMAFWHPFPGFHDLFVHHRDLAGRTAKAYEPQLEPETESLPE